MLWQSSVLILRTVPSDNLLLYLIRKRKHEDGEGHKVGGMLTSS